MATLLLRLAGPMQSWGYESKFEIRRTGAFPTKSGVIGMLAAALGMSREEPLDKLCGLKFGVRVDKEGELIRDFHIAKGEKSYITNRYYLSDAVFLAGFESEDREYLEKLQVALTAPAFPLFLGRRSCPPTLPLVLGIRDKELVAALSDEQWLLDGERQRRADGRLRIVIDDENGDGSSVMRDVPILFSGRKRSFGWRNVRDAGYVDKGETEHDPFSGLEGENVFIKSGS